MFYQLGALFDEVIPSSGIFAGEVARDGENVAILFEHHAGSDPRARVFRRTDGFGADCDYRRRIVSRSLIITVC